jgi:hypothetical protein
MNSICKLKIILNSAVFVALLAMPTQQVLACNHCPGYSGCFGWCPYPYPEDGISPQDSIKTDDQESKTVHACGTASIWTLGEDELIGAEVEEMNAVAKNLCGNQEPAQSTKTVITNNQGQASACADFQCR